MKEALTFSKEFPTNEADLVTQLGKFEGELRITPYFWFMAMHSLDDDTIFIDDIQYSVFNIDDDDRVAFPELADIKVVALYEDSQGFVYTLLDPILE